MRITRMVLLVLLLLTFAICSNGLSANDFPSEFIFGVGSAAYQYEGAAAEEGRKPSIWDTFVHIKGSTFDGGTGDVAVDQYHRYKEDVGLMSMMGVDAYKLSISWSRLIPGIQPHVTLYHFDLPQVLEDAYGGFISPRIVEDFVAYANICFREFGDRVKHWITFNEPNIFSFAGYDNGSFPPQRCSHPFGNCRAGNSTVEPYIVGHNVLLAHASVVELYRGKYQAKQKGWIGLVVLFNWAIPLTNKSTDIAATQRYIDFQVGWFLDPLVYGKYPVSMRRIVDSRLPMFTEEQAQKIQGSLDFVGINHYFTRYCFDVPREGSSKLRDFSQDQSLGQTAVRDGIPISNRTSLFGVPVVPESIQTVLEYVKDHYHNIPAIGYENGFAERNIDSITVPEALNDQYRIDLHQDVLEYVLAAFRNGSDIKGYFIWTLLDDFEVLSGYSWRFGLYYVDFNDNLKRYPKLSAQWYKRFLNTRENKTLGSEKQFLQNRINMFNVSLKQF